MESKNHSLFTLEKEVRATENYLSDMTKESNESFTWNCKLDPKVDSSVPVPESLLKCFVENSFINKVSQHPEGGKVDISLHHTTLGILIMVTDNGALRYQEYNRRSLIGKRLEKLDYEIEDFNKQQECNISYQLLDLDYAEPGKTGTRVLITIVQ